MPDTTLLEKLKAIQKRRRLSDQDFGKLLGIPRSNWQAYRTGQIRFPRPEIYAGIINKFPTLICDIVDFLKDGYESKEAESGTVRRADD